MFDILVTGIFFSAATVAVGFIWNVSANIERVNMREKTRRTGSCCRRRIKNALKNDKHYDIFKDNCIRQMIVLSDLSAGFFEGLYSDVPLIRFGSNIAQEIKHSQVENVKTDTTEVQEQQKSTEIVNRSLDRFEEEISTETQEKEIPPTASSQIPIESEDSSEIQIIRVSKKA